MFREDGVICLSALAVQSLDTAVVKAVEATLIVSRMIFSTFVTGRVWLVRFAPKYATRAVSREIPQSELIPRSGRGPLPGEEDHDESPQVSAIFPGT